MFDTTRIRRLVPAFQPRIPFHLAVRGIVAWRAEHLELTRPDADTDRRIARLVAAKHAADAAYRNAGAAAAGAGEGEGGAGA
ncbi:hypothetical protein [Clavibacter tessellarius]|uniref:hypothetical protein n=1 Tax=Clavibacter tessellarius TaxID=31965 RepID=UPI00324B303C